MLTMTLPIGGTDGSVRRTDGHVRGTGDALSGSGASSFAHNLLELAVRML